MWIRGVPPAVPLDKDQVLSVHKNNYREWRLRMIALFKERFALDIVARRLERPDGPPRKLGREPITSMAPLIWDAAINAFVDPLHAYHWDDAHDVAFSQILLAVSDDVLTGYEGTSDECNKAAHLWLYIEGLFSAITSQNRPQGSYRVLIKPGMPRSILNSIGVAPTFEPDGRTPVLFGSTILEDVVIPCKVTTDSGALLPWGGWELAHTGIYTVLVYDPTTMELVHTSNGAIPTGRRAILGGHGTYGQRLYHAVATVRGVKVPGKTEERADGCWVGFDGSEHFVQEYELLSECSFVSCGQC